MVLLLLALGCVGTAFVIRALSRPGGIPEHRQARFDVLLFAVLAVFFGLVGAVALLLR